MGTSAGEEVGTPIGLLMDLSVGEGGGAIRQRRGRLECGLICQKRRGHIISLVGWFVGEELGSSIGLLELGNKFKAGRNCRLT